jgi:hypothetical protein
MGFFQSLKCKMGFHDWSVWSEKVEGDCIQSRRCKACNRLGKQKAHNWGEYEYISTGVCDKERACLHCGERARKNILAHVWSETDWKYTGVSESCEQERRCPRCGAEEERTLHIWDVWQYESPDSDMLVTRVN